MSTTTKTAVKSLDCPLCKKKEAIPFDSSYRFGPHAKKCLALVEIHEDYKTNLLKAKILGEDYKELFSDSLTIDDYQNILKEHGFEIKAELFRKPNELHPKMSYWHCRMFIKGIGSTFNKTDYTHFPEVSAKYPDEAFKLLRHFLICGEVIRVDHGFHVEDWRWEHDKKDLVNHGKHSFPDDDTL